MTFKGTLHKDDNDKWHVVHFQTTLNGPLFQSLPIVKDTFDINNPKPVSYTHLTLPTKA